MRMDLVFGVKKEIPVKSPACRIHKEVSSHAPFDDAADPKRDGPAKIDA